jgi:hypothetical protein
MKGLDHANQVIIDRLPQEGWKMDPISIIDRLPQGMEMDPTSIAGISELDHSQGGVALPLDLHQQQYQV